jgi:PAS domain S-box-containing protein
MMNSRVKQRVAERATTLFKDHQLSIYYRTDHLFANLMLCQWIAAIAAAVFLTPRTWAGQYSQIHIHIWAAVGLGGAITLLPVLLVRFRPGEVLTRQVIAVSQMLMSALLIHLTGGRIETHFHVFGSLAFLAFYRDWRVFIPATLVVAADHFIRGVYWPQSVFGILTASPWRWIEHAAWVIFEDAFLIRSCLQSVAEMKDIAHQRAELEATKAIVEGEVLERTAELRASKSALQHSERRYRMLFEDSPVPMVVFDAETLVFLAVNEVAEQLYGYTREELLRLTLEDTRAPEDVPQLLEFLKRTEAADSYRGSFRIRRKDGHTLAIETRGRTIEFLGRRARLALMTDITEQKRLESQLQQSQKMEAIGRLAGGIAHDFNNLLTVILGYSDSVLHKLGANHPLQPKVAEIHAAGERAANLTSQLLAFSRKQILQPQTLLLNDVIGNIVQMLERVLGEDIKVDLLLDSDLGQVQADVTQLEQVLLNLAVNARDAMPHGGQLVIETHNCELQQQQASLQGLPPGHYVVLSVSDTGCGMDEVTKSRIFEPFFTTKEVGKGTGLGLSMVLGVVQQSEGAISVYSELGVGTTFRIYLPRIDAPAFQNAETNCEPAVPIASGTVILLAEDEEKVRTLAREALSEAGYTVLEARDGKHALEVAEGCTRAPAMLLTDVVMPGMSGPELAEQLRDKWSGLPVIYTSGYTDHALLTRRTLRLDTPFLQKPYSRASLLTQVAAVLENARTPKQAVLIVEDDSALRTLLRANFEESGYAVLEAANGGEAIAKLHSNEIKLLITDLVMPECDGVETIQAVRKHHPDVKILAISGAFEGSFLRLANKIGADAVLRKPFKREEVLKAAEQLF